MDLTPEQRAIASDEQLSKSDRFRKLFETGLTIYQIAKAMNTHYPFVRSALARTHSSSSSSKGPTKADIFRQAYDEGLTVAAIAKRYNAYYSHVYQVIEAYKSKKLREAQVPERPDTYLFLDGNVANLMNLSDVHRAYLDECIEVFRKGSSADAFRELVFGQGNPVLGLPDRPGSVYGVVTRAAYESALFQVLRDMLFRLEIRYHQVAPDAGDLVDGDPFADSWISPGDAATVLGVSLPAVHKAVEVGRLIAKPAKEGGVHRVISNNSLNALIIKSQPMEG